ncbi:MAG: transglycosylase SLT domain-containing protein [Gemmatimonadota bacterium]
MPRLLRTLPTIVALALLAGACIRGPVAAAPVPAGGAGGSAGGGAAAASLDTIAAPRDSANAVTVAEVSRETVRVFGDSAPPPVADSLTAPGAPVWDIDVHSYATHARVEDYLQIFSGRAKGIFATALQRQTRYGPMIRERLRGRGLPEDLTYLALVESWFDPHAYSRAAAVGIWQFMARTARSMGLRVDWWVDERRDPVRSTEAAARLLLGLRNQFGSLYLAAAAYNGGAGRVSRGLTRYADALDGVAGEDRFFALATKSYLRPETRDYVPKIIAAALVGEEPARYGVTVESLPPYAFDSVRTPGETPLAAVANAVGAAPADIAELNPSLLRGMTPPSDSMWIRVPVGSAAGFGERFDALESGERRALTRLESRKGQSMTSIARTHDLTARQLGWYNPKAKRLKSGALRAGQVILVPRRDVAVLARDVPNPAIEKYPVRRRASSARRAGAGTAKASAKKPAAKSGVSKPAAKVSAKKPAAKKPTVKKPVAKPAAR